VHNGNWVKNSSLLIFAAVLFNVFLFFGCIGNVGGWTPQPMETVADCEKLPNNEYLLDDQCYAKVGPKMKDSSLCEKIEAIDFKAFCYFGVAIATDNQPLCSKIPDEYWSTWCYGEYAAAKKDLSLCPANSKLNCYGTVAGHLNDSSICDGMPDQNWADDCYSKMATVQNNTFYCGKISNYYPGSRDECYYGLARKLNDPSICYKLSDSSFKDQCTRYILHPFRG
jgi:hypothetical protein